MNWSVGLVAEVPPEVVTVTVTVPLACAGDVTVIDVADVTDTLVAAVVPKETVVVLVVVNPVPVIVTVDPPVAGPVAGEIPVTVGVTEDDGDEDDGAT